MFNTLQGRQAAFEQSHGALRDTLPEPMFRFLSTAGSEWDTPVIGRPFQRPPIPSADVFDLRQQHRTEARKHGNTAIVWHDCSEKEVFRDSVIPCFRDDVEGSIGSNHWAVDGAHSASGRAILANDMHLSIGVPIIWYRASLVFPNARQPSSNERITGVTLPGIPSVVVGSNGHVAWGFTNSGGVERPGPSRSRSARFDEIPDTDGPKAFDTFEQTIAAKGGPGRTVSVAGRSGAPSCGRTRAGASTRSAGSRTTPSRWLPTSRRPSARERFTSW